MVFVKLTNFQTFFSDMNSFLIGFYYPVPDESYRSIKKQEEFGDFV